MSENLKPPRPSAIDTLRQEELEDGQDLRILSRSPHPYHHLKDDLVQPSGTIVARASSIPAYKSDDPCDQLLPSPTYTKDSTPNTDSGTEADDENFVKRLPAPKARLHKGLRGRPEALSGSATPVLTPTTGDGSFDAFLSKTKGRTEDADKKRQTENAKRKKEVIRRATEVIILGVLGKLVASNVGVRPVVALYKNEFLLQSALYATVLLIYPLRVLVWTNIQGEGHDRILPLSIPSSFDPAPALYPQVLPILVSLLTSANVKGAVLPNLILGIASIPRTLIPTTDVSEHINPLHWFLSCLPLLSCLRTVTGGALDSPELARGSSLSPDLLVFLYPLHQNLCLALHHLTTTSLLPAELQLLSISLLDLLILSTSPQAVILQALLWIGGVGLILLCGLPVRWGISLARVPKWRFKRSKKLSRPSSLKETFVSLLGSRNHKNGYGSETEDSAGMSGFTTEEDNSVRRHRRSVSSHMDEGCGVEPLKRSETIALAPSEESRANAAPEADGFQFHPRRHTLPLAENTMGQAKTHTPSGRRKRSASSSVRAFFSLTQSQANTRKWMYAAWVYLGIVLVILGFIRVYVQYSALDGNEPIGWALGYIFGDLPSFRFQVVKANLERWICLPNRLDEDDESCHSGWVSHIRHASIGEADTRLLICSYWVSVIVVGLAVVFRLSPYYEVDTRRKIFHFMMVAMFLPATYIDPAWCALALAIALAIFLLLDLLRASQLPPLSKPITNFLHPYTDGRDHCGPVVISHIFLLIGCAIPLWLSLASLPRTGLGYARGWEIPTRELSMVAGVVCVGLGDAAASLIGRRYGHHKWYWRGGKSLEGSVAFAAAVFVGLMVANIWLKIGAWPDTNPAGSQRTMTQGFDAIVAGLKDWSWGSVMLSTSMCASVASLTEAVLTGGNDNVVVPVVLWTCVKSSGL